MTGDMINGSCLVESGRRSSTTLKPCSNCRRRKVRCCKSKPCSNCVRSGMKCVYEGIGSIDESLSSRVNASNAELQDRLCRLENLLENLASATISDTASQNAHSSAAQIPYILFERSGSRPEEIGKVVFEASTSAYIDPSAWVHDFDQLEDLAFFLNVPQSDQISSRPTASRFVFSFGPNAPPPEIEYYPAIKQSERLVDLFFQNVHPFTMILHEGLFRKELDQYRRRAHPRQIEFEALLFSIHALTIATLPTTLVQALFADTKEHLVKRFGHEAEKALANCEVTKSRSVICLQAFLYHITYLLEQARYDEGSGLIGLAVRLAQRIGLNHDPSHFNFSAFKADQRRRLWMYLEHLDFRCCEDFSVESLCPTLNADCKRPKNVNDHQWETCPFSKKSAEPEGVLSFRDMTFVTLRHEVESVHSEIMRQLRSDASESAQTRVMQYRALMEQRILQYFDESDPMQRLVATYIRFRIDQIDIIAAQNYLRSCPEDEEFRKSLFISAVELLESVSRIESDLCAMTSISQTCSWLWILRSSIPWHAIAVTLTNLATIFQGSLATRAWGQIDAVFARFASDDINLVDTPVWTPVNQLRDQARFKRDTWLEEELGVEALASNSDDSRVSLLSPRPMSTPRTSIEVCPLMEVKGLPVEFNACFEADNIGVDQLMPDMQLDAQNEFFDFFALSSDQFNNSPSV